MTATSNFPPVTRAAGIYSLRAYKIPPNSAFGLSRSGRLSHHCASFGHLESAARNHLPSIYWNRSFVADGRLMSCGVDITDLIRRSADYVDRILKGAKPNDLPVQWPTTFDPMINRETAKALDIAIAPSLLAQADEVRE
jgi:ABC-type uncharacterized transport system substrate-binding protein